jgi:hypothetical protein
MICCCLARCCPTLVPLALLMPNELRPVTDWSNEVGEQVKSTLTENMQMIQQMQANLSARQLDANIDLMKSLYQRLRWAVQATDTFAPKQMQPLPLQLNTTLIRNALAGVAQATPLVPSGVNKSQMDALRAKASAQLDRLQQQKQQPQAASDNDQSAAQGTSGRRRASAQRRAAGGAARRRKKRPEYEESDEEDELEDDDDDEDD